MKRVIGPGEHVFVAGRTGSGKTFLARKYLANYPAVAVLDTKGLLDWPEVPEEEQTLITHVLDLEKVTTPKVIYRPVWQEMEEEYYNAFFMWCYRRGNICVWVDEAMSVCPSPLKMPAYYKAILTRGRELGVSAWSLTQRPSGIPLAIMSESSHFFVFDLNMEEDRDRVAKITGVPELSIKPGKYNFWYYFVEDETAHKARLRERKEVSLS